MKCEEFKKSVRELFGGIGPDEKQKEHMADCLTCREYYHSLEGMERQLAGRDIPAITDSEFNRVRHALHERIDGLQKKAIGFYQLAPKLATALVTIILIGVISFWAGDEKAPVQTSDVDSVINSIISDQYASMDVIPVDEEYYDVLVDDYVGGQLYGADEILERDLSEEEFDYLAKNLKVEDIL